MARAARILAAVAAIILSTLLPPTVARASAGTWGTYAVPEIEDFVVARDGSILGSDCGNARVYRVSPSGVVSVFAGAGAGGFDNGYSGDGGPAIDAHFGCIMGLVFAPDGSLLVTDHLNDVIRRIDGHGIVSTIAGSGPLFTWSKGPWIPGLKDAGDGGPALDAVFDAPWGIRFDPTGDLFIADRDHDAIRVVDHSGKIMTVAGTGQRGYGGDGGPATAAKLNGALDVAFPARGGFLIADENNARIRRVDMAGRITTFAGTGKLGCGGDGGPATAASLQNVHGITIAADGSVIASEGDCHRVRIIGPDGVIRPLVGSGTEGCSGFDGGLAAAASFEAPEGVVFDAGGSLLVSDPDCQVVVRLDQAGRLHVVADLRGLGNLPS